MDNEKNTINSALDRLIGYLDNHEPISEQYLKIALKALYGTTREPRISGISIRMVNLIDKRIKEIINLAQIISNDEYTETEKMILGFESLPFIDGDIDTEKKIISKICGEPEYKSYQELLSTLIYNERNNPEEIDAKITEFIDKYGITFDTIRKNQEENKENVKTRSNK